MSILKPINRINVSEEHSIKMKHGAGDQSGKKVGAG